MASQPGRLVPADRFSRGQFLRLAGGLAAGAAIPGALAACGGGSGSGGGTATLSLIGVADEKAPLDALTKAYHDATPKTTFRTSYAPTDQAQTAVRAQLNSANAADIHLLYPGDGSAMSIDQVARTGLLADLSSQSWVPAVPSNFQHAYQYQGKTYLFSSGLTVIGTIYNKKAFQQAGVSIPKTWSELLASCDKFKKAGLVPIALGAQTQWVTQLITYALVACTVYPDTSDFDDQQLAGKVTFAQSGWRQAFQMYMDLRDQGYFNDNPNGTTLEQQTSLVGTGKAAMAVQVAPLLPAFRAAAGSSAADIDMFPFPGSDNADKVWTWGAANVGLGVHAKSKHKAAALDFIEWLGQQQNINRWSELASAIPIKRDANSKVDPALTSFLPLLDANKATPIGQRWPNPEVQPTHFAVVQDLLAKKITIDEALKRMDEAYKKSQ